MLSLPQGNADCTHPNASTAVLLIGCTISYTALPPVHLHPKQADEHPPLHSHWEELALYPAKCLAWHVLEHGQACTNSKSNTSTVRTELRCFLHAAHLLTNLHDTNNHAHCLVYSSTATHAGGLPLEMRNHAGTHQRRRSSTHWCPAAMRAQHNSHNNAC